MVRFILIGILLMETRAFLRRRQPGQEAKALVDGEGAPLDEWPAADG
ncbi:hypothetical protein ACPCSC_22295 [Streptomyces lavendulocolor]